MSMVSALDLEQSKGIKATIDQESSDQELRTTQGGMNETLRALLRNSQPEFVSSNLVCTSMDASFEEFMSPEPQVVTTCDRYEKLKKWVQDTSVEKLAKRLSTTPSMMEAAGGEPAITLSPYQRLLMTVYVNPPFSATSKVCISKEDMEDLACIPENGAACRRPGAVEWELTAIKGEARNIGVLTLRPGCGKTAIGVGIGILMATRYYERTVDEFVGRWKGKSTPPCIRDRRFARLVMVCAKGVVNAHFVRTAKRMIPSIERKAAGEGRPVRIVVWDSCGKKKTNLEVAFEVTSADPTLVIVWVVSQERLGAILSEHPTVGIVLLLYDELEGVPSRIKLEAASAVMKTLVLQATPFILATLPCQHKGPMAELLGRKMAMPSEIATMVRNREYRAASDAALQLATMNLAFTNEFRNRIGKDLMVLFPSGIDYIPVRTGMRSLANHIRQEGNDIAPSNLRETLRLWLSKSEQCHSTEFMDRVFSHMVTGEPVDMRGLITLLQSVDTLEGKINYATLMAERLSDFSQACPICYQEEPSTEPRVRGCCGYTTCTSCWEKWKPPTCPNCRFPTKPLQAALPQQEANIFSVLRNAVFPPDTDMRSLSFVRQNPTESSGVALLRVMLYLKQRPRSRVFIMCNMALGTSLGRYLTDLLHDRTGFVVELLDHCVRGCGTKFAPIKEKFDGLETTHMALIATGNPTNIIIGMDLAHCDAVLLIGSVKYLHVAQAIGRVFRPLHTGAPRPPLELFNISSFPESEWH